MHSSTIYTVAVFSKLIILPLDLIIRYAYDQNIAINALIHS